MRHDEREERPVLLGLHVARENLDVKRCDDLGNVLSVTNEAMSMRT